MMGKSPAPRGRQRRAHISEAMAEAALEAMRGRPARPVGAPPRAGAVALAIVRPLLKDEGLTLNELKRRWPEIVGEKLAKLAAPEKLVKGPNGATLTIAAASSAAPFVQHQERLILERCALAGGRVTRIVISQTAAARPSLVNVRPITRIMSAEDERALSLGLARVEDHRLKDALARLGRAVATRA